MRLANANWPLVLTIAAIAMLLLFVLEFFADRLIVSQAAAICADSEIDYVATEGWGAWVECTALEGADG